MFNSKGMRTCFHVGEIREVKHKSAFALNSAVATLAAAMVVVICSSTATPAKAADGYSHSVLKPETTSKKLAKGNAVNPETPVTASYLGRAPYVCSPSGFGRTSICFAR
jgi:hypothetical protein